MSHTEQSEMHPGMQMMDMRMYMIINWDYKVRFVFNTWKSTTQGEFVGGLFVTMFFCAFLCLLPVLKGFAERQKSLFLKIVWQLLAASQSSITMFLLMTVNGWVFLAMALGIGFGSFIFYPQMPISEKHQREDDQQVLERVN
ncbi:unnamed protein product (macronuclear) [Paramecium tetraurelia]|uniref:Copper transport protein n=1 Tax=Paramecium tetraurelia TaxID=5888 RepID=A0EGJ4_PARTE|nr:uncharacterized protein GSPATT00026759001 [Paramecium tetraurelia]CAK94435.1 unnamed protein product [Paramecium tetraurelia]|eukprot:XP_001461808.1 hypothetical protein (macronuclear) [Paramecium tetraurelia strain d4-2]